MQIILEITSGPEAGRKVTIGTGQTLTIGRMPTADLAIASDASLSRTHFLLECLGRSCRLQDLNSSHGTFLDGEQVGEATIAEECEIRAGKTTFFVRLDPDAADTPVAGRDRASDNSGENDPYASLGPDEMAGIHAKTTAASAPVVNPPASAPVAARAPAAAAAVAAVPVAAPVPRSPAVGRPPQGKLQFAKVKCHSPMTLFRGSESTPPPASVAWLLRQAFPMYLIADFSKLNLPLPEELEQPTFLFNWMDDDVLPHCSPVILSETDPVDPYAVIDELWSQDALMCVFTKLPKPALVKHLRAAMRRDDGESTAPPKGILGYCWPDAGRPFLSDGSAKMLDPLVNGIDAFLVESAPPDCWDVYCTNDSAKAVRAALSR
jgi:hypothetical protein